MNNNRFKSEILDFISCNDIQLVKYEELSLQSLNSSDFQVTVKSNRSVLHTLTLSYHLHVRKIVTEINGSNLTCHTFDSLHKIIDFCNKKRKEIGYSE